MSCKRCLTPKQVATALAEADGRTVMAAHGEWVFIFNPPAAALDVHTMSRTFGEAAAFRVDRRREYWCRRAKNGEMVRSVEQSRYGRVRHEGVPGQKREPDLTRVDGETILAFAEAWHCDPRDVLDSDARGVTFLTQAQARRAMRRRRVLTPPIVPTISLTAVVVGGLLLRLCYGFARPPINCPDPEACEQCVACEGGHLDGGGCADLDEVCAQCADDDVQRRCEEPWFMRFVP